MATYGFSQIHLAEGLHLVDLTGTKADLEMACEFIERLITMLTSASEGSHLDVEALAIAAIIRYGRAFKGGVRKIGKAQIIFDLPSDIKETHNLFLMWRDKHIAHSVNDFETALLQARYCVERLHDEGITQVNVTSSQVISPGTKELEALLKAAQFFIVRLERLIELESARVLKIVRELPVDEVLARDLPAMIPGNDKRTVGKPRKK